MWILTIRSPLGAPREYMLKAGRNTLGRKSDNDIVIADVSASRLHAEIDYNSDSNVVVLHDLDSTNGTFVNRERVAHTLQLHPGDQIRVGQMVVNVAYQDLTHGPVKTDKLPGT